MADITLSNRSLLDESVIGAMICRTPKNLTHLDDLNSCILIKSSDDLISYFGDPYIDPASYTDLMIALDLINGGIPVYISSIDDMKHNNDDFSISYNGFTEFWFLDNSLRKSIGYKLKSDIKFCQPIIQFSVNDNILDLSVSSYLIDRESVRSSKDINKLDPTRLYTIYSISFEVSKVPRNESEITDDSVTDDTIISSLSSVGFELKLLNCYSKLDFIRKILDIKRLNVAISQPIEPAIVELPVREDFDSEEDFTNAMSIYNNYITNLLPNYQRDLLNLGYSYDLHSNDYSYNIDDPDTVISEYSKSISNIKNALIQPHWMCISQIYKSSTSYDDNDNIIRSTLVDLDPASYLVIFYYLLNSFTEDSDTYLFISMPDISVATALKLLTCNGEFSDVYYLPSQYNCDLFFGYITDYVNSSLIYNTPTRVSYSSAILSMYNLMINKVKYLSNSLSNLNIANRSVKTVISKSSAEDFATVRCNTPVLFETGSISVYGDRSLSSLPHLRYSHISRNLVFIRRLVREYLLTRQFTLNTMFNLQSSINYIKSKILDQFILDGSLQDYDISYSYLDKTVYIMLNLQFAGVAQSIQVQFTI